MNEGHDHHHPHPFQPGDDTGPSSEHMLLVPAAARSAD